MTEREKRVGVTKSRVEEVSLAEQDASRRGSDLPNWVEVEDEVDEDKCAVME